MTKTTNSSLYNGQPTPHILKPPVFLHYHTLKKNLTSLLPSLSSNVLISTDTEDITLCNLLLKYKTCFATHKNDVGKIASSFRIGLNAQLMIQCPTKVPIHYRYKLNAHLKELEKHNIIKQIDSSLHDKPDNGTTN